MEWVATANPPRGDVFVRAILRIEAAIALIVCVWAYRYLGGSWRLLALLFLLPDLSMLGYLRDPRTGAWLYNVAHTYFTPVALAGACWLVFARQFSPLWLIWPMHIAFDRLLGFGLKYLDAFRHTHLSTLREMK